MFERVSVVWAPKMRIVADGIHDLWHSSNMALCFFPLLSHSSFDLFEVLTKCSHHPRPPLPQPTRAAAAVCSCTYQLNPENAQSHIINSYYKVVFIVIAILLLFYACILAWLRARKHKYLTCGLGKVWVMPCDRAYACEQPNERKAGGAVRMNRATALSLFSAETVMPSAEIRCRTRTIIEIDEIMIITMRFGEQCVLLGERVRQQQRHVSLVFSVKASGCHRFGG